MKTFFATFAVLAALFVALPNVQAQQMQGSDEARGNAQSWSAGGNYGGAYARYHRSHRRY